MLNISKSYIFSTLLLLAACGSSDSTTPSSDDSATDDSAADDTSLALTSFPTDFVVASPVAKKSTTALRLAESSDPVDFETQKAALTELLESTDIADCTFTLSAAPTNSPLCYGPSLDYKSHPDYVSGGSADGNFPGGDLGIWTQYASSDTDTTQESCVSAKMNSLIGQASTYVGNAETAMAYLQCVAKNTTGVSLPTTSGASIDLLTAVSDAAPAGLTFTAASISYSADYTKEDDSTSPIYISTLSFEDAASKITYTINLKHTTTDTTNNYYKGKLWVYAVPGTGSTHLQKTAAYSVMYEKATDSLLEYSLRNGNFVTTATESDMFDDDKTVKTPVSNDGYSWGIFSVNPEDGTGKVAYAWVAGTIQENARTFLASVSADADGKKTGVGYFGFGDSMENILSEYTTTVLAGGQFTKFLDRMICNWAGPSNSHTGVAYVQKQLIEQDSTTGVFKPTSSNITYVPRNSCGMGTSENNTAFTYRAANTTDAYVNFGTSNLVTISSEKAGANADVFEIPIPPTEF